MDLPWQRTEYSTMGVDEYLQGIGGDPYHGLSRTGLRIPALVTPAVADGGLDNRYLFLLAAVDINDGESVIVKSIRQYLTIGALIPGDDEDIPPRPIECLVGGYGGNPSFRLTNGSVSWHFRIVSKEEIQDTQFSTAGKNKLLNFKCNASNYGSPCLLSDDASTFGTDHPTYYTELTNYTAPNGGKPPGDPLCPGLGTIYDVRYPWTSAGGEKLDIVVPRSGVLMVFASVRQSVGVPAQAEPAIGLSVEENFVINYPGGSDPATKYWAVGIGLGLERRRDGLGSTSFGGLDGGPT